jgi:hypothetical protein
MTLEGLNKLESEPEPKGDSGDDDNHEDGCTCTICDPPDEADDTGWTPEDIRRITPEK